MCFILVAAKPTASRPVSGDCKPVMVWILQDLIGERMKEGLKDLMLDLEAGQSGADFQQKNQSFFDKRL